MSYREHAPTAALGAPGARLAAALDEAGDPVAELRRWLEARARLAPAPDPLVSATVTRLAAGAGRLDALAAAHAGAGLARAAFDAGYADQAHFTNDCRALAGVPPSALVPAPGR